MRLLAVIALLLSAVGAFVFFREKPSPKRTPYLPVIEKKPFVIVIPTFNDAATIEQTLFSALSQRYDNFRLLIIDDHSLDETVEKAKKCISYFDAKQRATLIQNSQSCGILGCLYNGIHSCHDQEIAVVLLGGDRLAGPDVLKRLNQSYASPNTWMTCGNSLDIPSFKKSFPGIKPLKKAAKPSSVRKGPCNCSLPLTFYSTLFKEIPIADLFYRGQFYAMGWECAVGMPLLEMAGSHAELIEEPLYLLELASDKCDRIVHSAFYKTCQEHICSRPPHRPLDYLSNHPLHTKEKADLVLFSNNQPMQLFALLESIERHVIGYDEISVFYAATTTPLETAYLEIQVAFPKVHFIRTSDALKQELAARAFSPAFSSSPYVVFAKDGIVISDLIHLGHAIQSLESAKAYALYFDLHTELSYSSELNRYQPPPPSTAVEGISSAEPLRAWQLSKGQDDWSNRGSFYFTLYRKADLAAQLSQCDYQTPEELLYAWNITRSDAIGLFPTHPKVISLKPSPCSQGDLERFLSGLKLDLSPFFQMEPPQREITINSSFAPRSP